jgi:hypothetical protein
MMGERRTDQAALFYEFSLERHVPATHLLRLSVCTINKPKAGLFLCARLQRDRSRQAVHIFQGENTPAIVFYRVSFAFDVARIFARSLERFVLHSSK